MKKIFALTLFSLLLVSTQSTYAQWTTVGNNIHNSNTGYVGIGTSNPLAPLHVIGVLGSDHAESPRFLMRRTGGNPIMWNFEAGAFVQQNGFAIADLTNGQQKFVIESNLGNAFFPTGGLAVGTATMPAGYTLAVAGKLIAEEIEVTLKSNWPDYVFSEDYSLMSIGELEEFINKNGHLPDVPPAAMIDNGTVNLGEMSATLMKKIEELTLYLIEIKKENDLLRQEIARIK